MSAVRKPFRRALLAVIVPAVLAASCGTKEQAPPPSTTLAAAPSAAPATTATAATTTTTTTLPPPVWRTTRWGMTRREVLAALPGEAQRLPQAVDFGAPVGGSTDVAIPSYEADGVKFRVLLGFDADALNRVHLNAGKATGSTCADLEKALTGRHGEPADRSTAQTSSRVTTTTWKRPDQTVTLTCTEVQALNFRTVALDYTPPAP
jgi:hypothetical protein